MSTMAVRPRGVCPDFSQTAKCWSMLLTIEIKRMDNFLQAKTTEERREERKPLAEMLLCDCIPSKTARPIPHNTGTAAPPRAEAFMSFRVTCRFSEAKI